MTLRDHLATGTTTVCRCWRVDRPDGARLGFTDHDRDVAFGGDTFRADTGLTARALVQGTGLSVDNSEALGILSDDAVTEADIEAGRYDGAEVRAWLVNWQDTAERELRFRGTIGDIARGAGGFQAELRGLTEAFNVTVGRSYLPVCDARLGDAACRVDLDAPGLRAVVALTAAEDNRVLRLADPGAADGAYARGLVEVQDGAAAGLAGRIKSDRILGGLREISLWEPLRADLSAGDTVRVTVGCDKSAETCKAVFGNFVNFRGFPQIPGEDWLAAVPRSGAANDGGKRS